MHQQKQDSAFATALLHPPGEQNPFGSTTVPVFQTSAFSHLSAEEMERIFQNTAPGFTYSRLGNPTIAAFEQRMAAAENGFAATACASGSAAIATTLLSMLRAGDDIIASAGLYGGTLDFFRDLEAFDIHVTLLKTLNRATIAAAVTPHTKAVFAETVSNPGLRVLDIKEAAEAAHAHGIPLIVDSTIATPVLVRPIDFGADIVIHSSSKYINGAGSAISGVIVDGGHFSWNCETFSVFGNALRFGKAAFTARLRTTIWRNIGATPAPVHAFLNLGGLETLSLRMERICKTAEKLARFLESEGVPVRYPGLESSGEAKLVQTQFQNGLAGGILTVRLGSKEAAFRFINALRYAKNVSNIGDSKTLVIHPASTIFLHANEEERLSAGVFNDLVRVSVGLEDPDDLIHDFKRALQSATSISLTEE